MCHTFNNLMFPVSVAQTRFTLYSNENVRFGRMMDDAGAQIALKNCAELWKNVALAHVLVHAAPRYVVAV